MTDITLDLGGVALHLIAREDGAVLAGPIALGDVRLPAGQPVRALRRTRAGVALDLGGPVHAVVLGAPGDPLPKSLGPAAGVCASAIVATKGGQVPAGDLSAGAKLRDADGGVIDLVWVGETLVPQELATLVPTMRPVQVWPPRLEARAPLLLGPAQLVLTGGGLTEVLFGDGEVLAPSASLVNGATVRRAVKAVRLVHLVTERPALFMANGVVAATQIPDEAGAWMSDRARSTLETLLSERPGLTQGAAPRPVLSVEEGRMLR